MTKLRYVGTYAQEFPGPNDTVTMYGPGEFLEDADTENEDIKAAMERGELISTESSGEQEGFVFVDNEPDQMAQAQPQTAPVTTGTGEEVTNA